MVAFENKAKLAAELKQGLGADLSDFRMSRPELTVAKGFRVDTNGLEAKVENAALGTVSYPSAPRFTNRPGYAELLDKKEAQNIEKAYGAHPRRAVHEETLTQLSLQTGKVNYSYQSARAANQPVDSGSEIPVAQKALQASANRLKFSTSDPAVVNTAYEANDLQVVTRFRMNAGKVASAKAIALN